MKSRKPKVRRRTANAQLETSGQVDPGETESPTGKSAPGKVGFRLGPDTMIGPFQLDERAQKLAVAMTYVVRNRRRWVDREETRRSQSAQTRESILQDLSIDEAALRQIAHAGVVEVVVPFTAEHIGWEARLMPWEYVLSGATRDFRYNRPLTVTRQLLRPNAPPGFRSPERLLFIETAPCDLRDGYTFDFERKLVHEGVGAGFDVQVLRDPTRAELENTVSEFAPDLIHISGFDNHQGMTLIGLADDPDRRDGVLLRREDNGPDPVPEEEIARLLTCAAEKPLLVSLNLFNTAGRVAPMIVAHGAGAAVGFQDEFDDPLAELLFAVFYRACRTNWNAHQAFNQAMTGLRAHPGVLQGTGVALWTAYSQFDQPQIRRVGQKRPVRAASASRTASTASAAVATSGDVEIKVDPIPQLNYSMLHNNRELFYTFLLRNFSENQPQRVHVKVSLFVGTESYPCETSFLLTEPVRDLSREIHVPLISSIGRSVRESMRTSLYVEVRINDQIKYAKTHPVTLLPIDEWRDDDDNRHWLPSFVLPRDPAVPRIIDASQRYLMALRDDPNAGFDGYQSYNDGTTSDPGDPIDLQVQAIWSALLYELPLSYINPPPTFTEYSQRVRAPSDVIGGKRGTCIDLAVLLASCLEYVEIYPVVILLEGHAFPGYWRSADAHGEFERVVPPSAVRRSDAEALREITSGQLHAWYFDKSCYREIKECIQRNELVLLETVGLTRRSSFWQAVNDGFENMRTLKDFHSMMDIVLARACNVTPLPVLTNGAIQV